MTLRWIDHKNAQPLLAAGGLFLTLLAACGAAAPTAAPTPMAPAAPPPMPPDTPAAARVAAGAARQGDFTLLAVTRGGPSRMSQAVPPAVPVLPGPLPSSQTVMTTEDATGLWIGVRGGIGFRTVAVPDDHRRHVYPFGPAALVVDETLQTGYSTGWFGPGGVSRVAEGVAAYGIQDSWAAASPGHPAGPVVTLVPCRLRDRFTVTAQPLDAAGRALGRPAALVCQSVTPDVLFAQFPAAYSARTRQFRVTVARHGADPGAAWRLAGLPLAVRNGPDSPPDASAAGFGPLTIRAAAAEAEDLSGYPDWWNRHPPRDAGGGWTRSQPQGVDGHQWTGVPSVRLLLAAHNASPDGWKQLWTVEVERITPQWGTPAVFQKVPGGRPYRSFPVYYHGNDGVTPAYPFVSEDWQVGAAWPGQQRWVRIDGAAIRQAWRTETVTFHDAQVVHDAGFGGDRIVWRHPETVNTASGIAVTVLNGRAGVPDQGPGLPYAPVWRFDGGSAEMLLAWRLPPGVASSEHAAFNDPRMAEPPSLTGALGSEWDISHPLLWGALAAPGAQDAGALEASGDGPLRFSVRSTAWAPLPPPPARREGPVMREPAPLPPLIKAITFQINLREEQERHPFHLWVPVRTAFPPGWDADAADSRSRNQP